MDVEAARLADYGKHGEYVSRQVKTWTRQYEASKTGEIQAMDKVTIRDISDPNWSVCHSSSSFRYMLSLLVNKQCHQVRKVFIAFLLDDIA